MLSHSQQPAWLHACSHSHPVKHSLFFLHIFSFASSMFMYECVFFIGWKTTMTMTAAGNCNNSRENTSSLSLSIQWIIRWCECKTFLNNIINAHRQFNLVWNKLVFIFAFAVVGMMRVLRWKRTTTNGSEDEEEEEKMKRGKQNRYYWRGKITGMWTIFVFVIYISCTYAQRSIILVGLSLFGTSECLLRTHAQSWTNNGKNSPNNALSLRSTCRFLRCDSIRSGKKFSFGRAHALVEFSIFSGINVARSLVCCCRVRLHKSIKNYVRFCRNFVPTFVKMSSARQIAYYCHFSSIVFGIIESPMRICFNFLFVILFVAVSVQHRAADSVKFNRLQFLSY